MRIIRYPRRDEWDGILARPTLDNESLRAQVADIMQEVKTRGDSAVRAYEAKFDHVTLTDLEVSPEEWEAGAARVNEDLALALARAARNIEKFHAAQQLDLPDLITSIGVRCSQRALPIRKVGLYIPGGNAPLFSTVLMLGIPARIAGCAEIELCTPPDKEGNIHPAILHAAKLAGVTRVYKIGGVQAIAAMTYGTESVGRVYKIFGPGNQYVTAAKQLAALQGVAIDMPAGPSEVEVLADEHANPAFVAADMLSQAEHGKDSQAVVITTSEILAGEVEREVNRQLSLLPRQDLAEASIGNSRIIVVGCLDEAIEMSNEYAPEHLIIQTLDPHKVADRITDAGSLFIGNLTPESAGDYASGTNHTLPTNGYAKAYSGVNLDSFMKKMTLQEITPEGLEDLGGVIELMAEHEGLYAHRNAVSIRLAALCNPQ